MYKTFRLLLTIGMINLTPILYAGDKQNENRAPSPLLTKGPKAVRKAERTLTEFYSCLSRLDIQGTNLDKIATERANLILHRHRILVLIRLKPMTAEEDVMHTALKNVEGSLTSLLVITKND